MCEPKELYGFLKKADEFLRSQGAQRVSKRKRKLFALAMAREAHGDTVARVDDYGVAWSISGRHYSGGRNACSVY